MSKRMNKFMMQAAITLYLVEYRATVKYGVFVTEVKGKIGGHVFQGSAAGGTIKTLPAINKSTAGGGKITKSDAGRVIYPQSNLGSTASNWRSLSESDRASWVAGAVNFPFKNKFGVPYTASGYQVFMRANINLKNVGEAQMDTCPAPASLLPTVDFSILHDTSVPQKLFFSGVVPAGYQFILYGTNNQSLGKNLTPGGLKAIKIYEPAPYVHVEFQVDYNKLYGTVPDSGNMWFQGIMTNIATGQTCIPYTFQLSY